MWGRYVFLLLILVMVWQTLCWDIVMMWVRVTFMSHLQAFAPAECIAPFQNVNSPYSMHACALRDDPGYFCS